MMVTRDEREVSHDLVFQANGANIDLAVEGQKVTVEYHWLEGQYDRLPALRRMGEFPGSLLPCGHSREQRSGIPCGHIRTEHVGG